MNLPIDNFCFNLKLSNPLVCTTHDTTLYSLNLPLKSLNLRKMRFQTRYSYWYHSSSSRIWHGTFKVGFKTHFHGVFKVENQTCIGINTFSRAKAQEYINELAKPAAPPPEELLPPEVPETYNEQNGLVLEKTSPVEPVNVRFPWLPTGYLQLVEEIGLIQQMDFQPACKRCYINTNMAIPSHQTSAIFNRQTVC